ncbi:MAG: 16S rRNA processing protein RimM [Deltaproteobacteria bacterium]|nr:MAG: 16S rRNA processing protein RimM [Deltaproteobacteria bacterium]
MSEGAGTNPERLVPLGEIVGTHGVAGLVRFRPYSDSAAALAAPCHVFLQNLRSPRRATGLTGGARRAATDASRPATAPPAENDASRPLRLLSARPHGRVMLLRLADVATIEAATPLIGAVLAIAEADLPATGPGEFYAYQLEGFDVVTSGGDRLGTVDHLIPTGSNEVLVVRDGAREHLIPVIADVVREVDLADRKIVIEPIEGLLD